MENQKIASFTGLRFIMIVAVHFEFLAKFSGFGIFYAKHLSNATFAVDFFFLLSGFGMMLGNINRVKTEDLKFPKFSECVSYGIRHVKKIYPVYLATILFGLVCNISYEIYISKFSLEYAVKEFMKLIVNIPLLQSATGMMFFAHAFNGAAWFLSTLFCIYIISPILMFCLRKISKSYFIDILLLLTDAFFIIWLYYLFSKIELVVSDIKGMRSFNIDYLAYASPYRRVFYVLMGMTVANVFSRLRGKIKGLSMPVASFFEIVVSAIAFAYTFMRNCIPELRMDCRLLIDTLLCSCFVLTFAFDKGIVSHLLKNAKMQKLGNMAMYIFLIHYPIRIYANVFFKGIIGEWTALSAFLFIAFTLFSTFAFSFAISARRDNKITLNSSSTLREWVSSTDEK